METTRDNRIKKLLFVEDDLLILDDLRSITDWDAAGYQILTAVNGKQGLQKYEEYRPELVVTDVKMPLMDGLEMMQAIRGENPYVQFLILSSYEDYAYLREALQLGAADYIRKPSITPELMREKVDALRDAWEKNAVRAWAQLKGGFRELWENEARTSETVAASLQDAQALCACFAPKDMLDPFREYAVKTAGRAFSSECFWAELEEALTPKPFSDLVTRAVRFIREAYGDPSLSNAMVAEHVALSERRLGVRFREETGQAIGEYIIGVRMEKARELLASGHMVYEVAEAVGYRSPQYFSSAFKAYTGMTPNEFREVGSQ